jgi:hypothetical protein
MITSFSTYLNEAEQRFHKHLDPFGEENWDVENKEYEIL